jgi:hypothetical protein
VAQLQQVWAQLNARERLVGYGSGLVVIGWLLGAIISGGYLGVAGVGIIALLGAVADLGVMYAKHAPGMQVTWPAPYAVILFGIGAVVGLLVLLQLLQLIGLLAFLGSFILPLACYVVGAALMAWGGYQEWTLTKSAA